MTKRLASIPGVVLISVAATLWGTDALIRRPLAHSTAPATIVFGEHVVLVALMLPVVLVALPALWRAGPRFVAAGIVIGAGSSAVATILFTQAFVEGDPVTPVVLQKLQPVVAVLAARVVLGERPRPRFAFYLLPALAGAWMIGVQRPFNPSAHGVKTALF